MLSRVDLRQNDMTVAGVMALAMSMKINTTVVELTLDEEDEDEEIELKFKRDIAAVCTVNKVHPPSTLLFLQANADAAPPASVAPAPAGQCYHREGSL